MISNSKLLENVSLDIFPVSNDSSVNSLLSLAYAIHESKIVQEQLGGVYIANRLLVVPSLERAYREMLYLRKQLPVDFINTTAITKLGRLINAEEVKKIFTSTYG